MHALQSAVHEMYSKLKSCFVGHPLRIQAAIGVAAGLPSLILQLLNFNYLTVVDAQIKSIAVGQQLLDVYTKLSPSPEYKLTGYYKERRLNSPPKKLSREEDAVLSRLRKTVATYQDLLNNNRFVDKDEVARGFDLVDANYKVHFGASPTYTYLSRIDYCLTNKSPTQQHFYRPILRIGLSEDPQQESRTINVSGLDPGVVGPNTSQCNKIWFEPKDVPFGPFTVFAGFTSQPSKPGIDFVYRDWSSDKRDKLIKALTINTQVIQSYTNQPFFE